MEQELTPDIVFHNWQHNLNKDRKNKAKDKIASNFDDFIAQLVAIKTPKKDIFDWLKRAIRVHQPTRELSTAMYNKQRSFLKVGKDEYHERWCASIESKAYEIYYTWFPVETEYVERPIQKKNEIDSEYQRQRAYADTFPKLDPQANNFKPIDVPEDILKELLCHT